MNRFQKKNSTVIIHSRKQSIVSCPYCWTDQLSSRNFCYRCGSEFIFLDEVANPSKRNHPAKTSR